VNIEQTIWADKHRPKELDDLILPSQHREDFEMIIKKKELPNLLLTGPAGGGKTTIAQILTSKKGVLKYKRDNLLEVNGSSKESRSITFVSDVIEPFLKIPPAAGDKYRVVFIDEGEQLTDASFKALKGIIEKYQVKYGRFILTSNYLSKIPDPILSRFTPYIFKQIPIEFVGDYCKNILDIENVEYDEKDLLFVIENFYPDVRKIVTNLQRFSLTGKLKVNRDVSLNTEKALIASIIELAGYLKNGENHKINRVMTTVLSLLDNQDLEFKRIYLDLFETKEIPVPAKIVINKYSNSHQSCLVPSMHFSAMFFEIIQTLNVYYVAIKKE